MILRHAAVAALITCFSAAPALAEGDAAKGEKVFNKCKTCHDVGEGAKNKLGPHLNGIVGAPMGAVDGFKYSDAIMARNAEGATWTEEALSGYLEKPKEFIPGNKMSFAGLKKEEDRANVIAYLKTFP